MKIAILGSGGREHALTFSISKSNKIKKIYCIPGNAGTSSLAENISIDINNFETVLAEDNFDFSENPNYLNFIDIESFIDFFIINELTKNIDGTSIDPHTVAKQLLQG